MNDLSLGNIRRGLRKLNRSFGVFDDQFWKSVGVTYAESQLMFAVEEYAAPILAKDLSRLLRIDKSGISRIVTKLHRKGHLKIVPAKMDQRSKFIFLTKQGGRLIQRLNDVGNQELRKVLETLTAQNTSQLERILRTLEDKLPL